MIYVDADACPVRRETETVAARHKAQVRMVTDGGIRPSQAAFVETVYVAEGPDAADDWIAERAGAGDVVVTADIPLAARAIDAGAVVVKPDGTRLDAKSIGPALATRNLMTDLRSADPFRQGSGKAFGARDRSRFLQALDAALRDAARGPARAGPGTETGARMSVRIVPPEAGASLDWIELAEAIAAGHRLPRARISEGVLKRGDDTLLTRSAWIDGMGLAVKAATIFPGNAAAGRPSVGGGVSVLSDGDGTLRAVIDFDLVTRWKTAADSLLGAMRLARPDSRRILIVGAGTVARALREAYGAAFPEARFAIWNRSPDRARALAADYPATHVAPDLETAVRAADIVTCATLSRTPILRGEWLRPGQHVDLIGAFRADMREADDTALTRARLFVDSRETTLDHIGELRDPLARGVIAREDIVADFYDLDRFTRAPGDITLFKNGGGAHLDLMTCDYILRRWPGDGA